MKILTFMLNITRHVGHTGSDTITALKQGGGVYASFSKTNRSFCKDFWPHSLWKVSLYLICTICRHCCSFTFLPVVSHFFLRLVSVTPPSDKWINGSGECCLSVQRLYSAPLSSCVYRKQMKCLECWLRV